MARRSLLSERAKRAIAEELGVGSVVDRQGWGAVSARTCGSIVRVAVEHGRQQLEGSLPPSRPPSGRTAALAR